MVVDSTPPGFEQERSCTGQVGLSLGRVDSQLLAKAQVQVGWSSVGFSRRLCRQTWAGLMLHAREKPIGHISFPNWEHKFAKGRRWLEYDMDLMPVCGVLVRDQVRLSIRVQVRLNEISKTVRTELGEMDGLRERASTCGL